MNYLANQVLNTPNHIKKSLDDAFLTGMEMGFCKNPHEVLLCPIFGEYSREDTAWYHGTIVVEWLERLASSTLQ